MLIVQTTIIFFLTGSYQFTLYLLVFHQYVEYVDHQMGAAHYIHKSKYFFCFFPLCCTCLASFCFILISNRLVDHKQRNTLQQLNLNIGSYKIRVKGLFRVKNLCTKLPNSKNVSLLECAFLMECYTTPLGGRGRLFFAA